MLEMLMNVKAFNVGALADQAEIAIKFIRFDDTSLNFRLGIEDARLLARHLNDIADTLD